MPKGYQTCISCGESVKGPKVAICPHCGNPCREPKSGHSVIPLASLASSEQTATRKILRLPPGYERSSYQITSAMSGACPIKLGTGEEFPSDDEILEWGLDVRENMFNQGYYLTNEALARWAREELNKSLRFAPRGDEMQYVGLVLSGLPDLQHLEVPA